MQYYNQNASVVYTDREGRQIDTFVIFDTDQATGLTHINYKNLKVAADSLVLHPKTVCQYHLPISDAFSFEMIRKLRSKYHKIDSKPKRKPSAAPTSLADMVLLANAS